MARIDWIEERLLNWARWKIGSGIGGMGYARVDLTDSNVGRDGYCAEARIPVNDVEGSETDDAVHRLPSELKATVIEAYTAPGGEADHLARLHCAKATLHARIGRAHRLLADHFSAKRDREQAERQRVEAIATAARPKGSFTP